MNWSGKMWALQTEGGTILSIPFTEYPELLHSREEARRFRKYHPTTKVVRVQVDVKVIE